VGIVQAHNTSRGRVVAWSRELSQAVEFLCVFVFAGNDLAHTRYMPMLQCTVMEVKVVEGLGTTVDVMLVNGELNTGDTVVMCGLNGPIETTIRALLTPKKMEDMRVTNELVVVLAACLFCHCLSVFDVLFCANIRCFVCLAIVQVRQAPARSRRYWCQAGCGRHRARGCRNRPASV
jgi:hypothetical protein